MKKMIPIKGSIFFKRPDKSAVTSAIGLGSFCASCWVMFSNIQCSFEHLSILTVFLQIQVDLRRPSNQPSLQNSYCNQGEIFIFQKTFFGFQKDRSPAYIVKRKKQGSQQCLWHAVFCARRGKIQKCTHIFACIVKYRKQIETTNLTTHQVDVITPQTKELHQLALKHSILTLYTQ